LSAVARRRHTTRGERCWVPPTHRGTDDDARRRQWCGAALTLALPARFLQRGGGGLQRRGHREAVGVASTRRYRRGSGASTRLLHRARLALRQRRATATLLLKIRVRVVWVAGDATGRHT
jgi:hypothetical protein